MTKTKKIYNHNFWENHLFLPVLCLSSNLTLASCQALHVRARSLKTSSWLTVLSRGISTEYLLDVRRFQLQTFTKDLIFDLSAISPSPKVAVTLLEQLSAPAAPILALGAVRGTVIDVLGSERFASGAASGSDQHRLPGFHKRAPFGGGSSQRPCL